MPENLREKLNAEEVPHTAGPGVIRDGRYMPPPADGDGKMWVRRTVLIRGEPNELYTIWRNVETAPLWQEQITGVTQTGAKTSHWVMQSGDNPMEWDSEIPSL